MHRPPGAVAPRASPLHPAVILTAGSFLLISLFQLPVPLLSLIGLPIVAATLWRASRRWIQLLWRVRWIMLVSAALLAWQTPGELLWPELGGWSPSREGSVLAGAHFARLGLALGLLALALQRLTPGDWLLGLHCLARPLRLLGLNPDRFALRLHLVLAWVEREPGHSGWRSWLVPVADEATTCCVALPQRSFISRDYLALALWFGALVVIWCLV